MSQQLEYFLPKLLMEAEALERPALKLFSTLLWEENQSFFTSTANAIQHTALITSAFQLYKNSYINRAHSAIALLNKKNTFEGSTLFCVAYSHDDYTRKNWRALLEEAFITAPHMLTVALCAKRHAYGKLSNIINPASMSGKKETVLFVLFSHAMSAHSAIKLIQQIEAFLQASQNNTTKHQKIINQLMQGKHLSLNTHKCLKRAEFFCTDYGEFNRSQGLKNKESGRMPDEATVKAVLGSIPQALDACTLPFLTVTNNTAKWKDLWLLKDQKKSNTYHVCIGHSHNPLGADLIASPSKKMGISPTLNRIFQSLPFTIKTLLSTNQAIDLSKKFENKSKRVSSVFYPLAIPDRAFYVFFLNRKCVNIVTAKAHYFFANKPGFHVKLIPSKKDAVFLMVQKSPKEAFPEKELFEKNLASPTLEWHQAVEVLLQREHDERTATMLYSSCLSENLSGYQTHANAADTAQDISTLYILESGQCQIRLSKRPDSTILKIYRKAVPLTLSTLIPILDNMGIYIDSEIPFNVPLQNTKDAWIHILYLKNHFSLKDADGLCQRLHSCLLAVLGGHEESDRFHRLITSAALAWTECRIFRAYSKYCKQIAAPFDQEDILNTLLKNTQITQAFIHFFHQRFSPESWSIETPAEQKARTALTKQIDNVVSQEEQMVWGRLLMLLTATKRTNFYQTEEQKPKAYLSLKIHCNEIKDLPAPQPLYEIFVYAPFMEGSHMRAGKVARGGLRASDRPDYRNEVLSLMRTQTLKNAVIVPLGAKGGFIQKETARYHNATLDPYITFIKGLLDVTDNIIEDKIINPINVRPQDSEDPYLVVAADKGTATRSDDANQIALSYNFWLGDAFASGGSNGYDHKKIGITAKGAFVSTKHHFQRLGISLKKPFRVIGIGDMSGDVFGNGMLLSKSIQLIAAFDHRHIFVDPAPDTVISFQERKRLFKMPRSSWQDYDPKLLSAGGGIYGRSEEKIKLSEKAKIALDISDTIITSQTLIRAILSAPAELLWLGGIGTFIRGSEEENEAILDKANHLIRVKASAVRAKVITEGANLGLTEQARIELGRTGIQLNTDAIDNAAGVTCSDYEVNLKIFLQLLKRNNLINEKERHQLLREMEKQVTALVLESSERQNNTIAHMYDMQVSQGTENKHLVEACALSQSPSQTFCKRMHTQQDHKKLTRSEISALLAYAKTTTYERIMQTNLPQDPFFLTVFQNYFPKVLVERFHTLLDKHPLRKEIIATQLANSITETLGPALLETLLYTTEKDPTSVLKAICIASALLKMPLGTDPQEMRSAALSTHWLLRHFTQWLAAHLEESTEEIGSTITHYQSYIELIQTHTTQMDASLIQAFALDIAALHTKLGCPKEDVVDAYLRLTEMLSLRTFLTLMMEEKSRSQQEKKADVKLETLCFTHLKNMAFCLLKNKDGDKTIQEWKKRYQPTFQGYRDALDCWHQSSEEYTVAFLLTLNKLETLTHTILQAMKINPLDLW